MNDPLADSLGALIIFQLIFAVAGLGFLYIVYRLLRRLIRAYYRHRPERTTQ